MVIVVGYDSIQGQIRAKLEQDDENDTTPLKMKLSKITDDISKFGIISALLIVTVLIIRLLIEIYQQGYWSNSLFWGQLLHFVMVGIVVIVVAVPEGLPLSVTLSLAFSVNRMLKDKNLVRRLYACETMGGADSICSDKTGTLTKNMMTLTQFWNHKEINVDSDKKKIELKEFVPEELKDLCMQVMVTNCSAELRPKESGSRTEVAILQFVERCGLNYETERDK